MKKEISAIHPELQKVAQTVPKVTYSKWNIWLFNILLGMTPAPRPPETILVKNMFIQSGSSRVRVRVYHPKSVDAPTPALLWMHGGGYVMGKPEQDDFVCLQYVQELGITVVSVDYRHAPKQPFPAGLEDCYTALKWMAFESGDLRIDKDRIAIGGGSAGGGLAAALAQLAHDRQEVKPAFQLLIYPMLDDRTVLRTDLDDSNNVAWDKKSNRFGWESYLGGECGAANAPDHAVPARRADLSNLPPAWLGVGMLDLFYEEGMAYAKRLHEAGVPCEVTAVPGAFHGFDVFDPSIPLVLEFRRSQMDAMKKYLFA